jgi:hypothetical protein
MSKTMRSLAVACAVLATTALGACSFTPVYSGSAATQPLFNLAYAKPGNRLEQLIYQELSLRFGVSESGTAPLVQVSASQSDAAIGLSRTQNPNKPHRVTVTARLTLTQRDGAKAIPVTVVRHASADYTTSGQVLADRAALTDASERAARAVAESLRLSLLAALNR